MTDVSKGILKPGFDEKTIKQNIDYLVVTGHTLEESRVIAEAYAQSWREFAGQPAQAQTPSVNNFVVPAGSHTFILPNVTSLAPVNNVEKNYARKHDALPEQNNDFHVVGKGRVLVVKGAPTPAEELRGEPFVNADRAALEKHVLAPLGISRDDVMLAWCSGAHGEDALEAFIKSANPDVIVCMSDETHLVKDKRSWNLPTLAEVRGDIAKFGEELARKTAAIRKRLDVTSHRQAYSVQLVAKGATPTDRATIDTLIHKADPVEHVVYGVVLDPYTVDTQSDWAPPKEIRKTAHDFLTKSGGVGLHHKETVYDARVVESFVEDYPPGELEKANLNLPHRVYSRKYSNGQVVHSGAWVIGVQLSDRLWKKFEAGEIAAFSMEGFGKRVPIEHRSEMPNVTCVELGEVANAWSGRTSDQTD